MNESILNYVIVPVSDISEDMMNVVMQTSINTIRKNLSKNSAVLKYSGEKPQILNPYRDYTYEEIFAEMQKPEWTPEDPR